MFKFNILSDISSVIESPRVSWEVFHLFDFKIWSLRTALDFLWPRRGCWGCWRANYSLISYWGQVTVDHFKFPQQKEFKSLTRISWTQSEWFNENQWVRRDFEEIKIKLIHKLKRLILIWHTNFLLYKLWKLLTFSVLIKEKCAWI